MKKNNVTFLTAAILFLLILCAGGGAAAGFIFFMPSFKEDPYYKYIDRGEEGEYPVIYGDTEFNSDYCAVKVNESYLLDMDFLVDYNVDKFLFWDEAEKTLTVTTPQYVVRMNEDENFYTKNGAKTLFNDSALYIKNEKVFIPISFVNEFYPINCIIGDDAVLIDNLLNGVTTASVKARNAAVRYEPQIKSTIAEKVLKGASVTLYGETEGFYKVRTNAGTIGYIKSNDIESINETPPIKKNDEGAELPNRLKGKKIVLVWDQIYGEGTNDWISGKISPVNIVSPTWLSLENGNGDIIDKSAKAYVDKAKASGYEVWPLFDNSFNADFTHEALKSTKTRQKMIDSLIEYAAKYGVTGINVDFESYRIDDGYYYTQFLRELGVFFRLNNIVSSVDLPVPTLQNSPTDREQIGKYIDYVIVMAYDQHWASSDIAGPVAGYDWVEAGINRTINYIPKEKVILGLPFYNRMWYTDKASGAVSTRDFDMKRVQDLFELRNAKMEWEENTRYYRGEYEYIVEGAPTKINAWIETADTLKQKAEIFKTYELGGLAGWKKGLETADVWEMLSLVVGG